MISVAIIGLGRMGVRHAKAVQDNPRCKLAAIVDPRGASEEWWGCDWHADIDRLPRPDLAIIASPSIYHADAVHQLQLLGPTVLVEKPAALSVAEMEPYHWNTFVSHTERYNPIVQQLVDVVTDIEGWWQSCRFSLVAPNPKLSGGRFFDLAIHDFDLYRLFTGRTPLPYQAGAQAVADNARFLVGYGQREASLSFLSNGQQYHVDLLNRSFMCDNSYTACYTQPQDAVSSQLADIVSFMDTGVVPRFLCTKRDALEAVRCAEAATTYAEKQRPTLVAG